ncbi:MAG: hypothetical protein S4CHLAM45_13060 [Chlamydiales bacterium]|nr:hypothetical protein [Chlamydiales bacterium]MCH9619795.1 hypothetical protein [Chlamydiales bacterium]MCH9623401.1 hypothetical protein [Chlamydiales bacterium]
MIRYCPEAGSFFDGENDLTQCEHHTFNFSSTGFFTPLNRNGEPLYESAFPLFNKMCGHLLWLLLWTFVVVFSNWLGPKTYLKTINPLLIGLIVLHLFLLGLRFTSLLLTGGIKSLFAPPLWVRITRQFQKGKGIELLKEYHLERHPGLLANLALAKALLQQPDASKEAVEKALDLCPKHPALQTLYHQLASQNFSLNR